MLELNDNGLYCRSGDFYIDPWKPVSRAVITHAHADHARWGHEHYLAQHHNLVILRQRLGKDISVQTVGYGEDININGVKVTLYPAGHIPGSAQVRIEYRGEVWVVSGDYKIQNDGLSEPFEPVKCDTFITESTFGLPVYKWSPQDEIIGQIESWWQNNLSDNRTSILFVYSLGKAQRILNSIDRSIGEIFVHGAVHNVNKTLIYQGIDLPRVERFSSSVPKERYTGSLVLAPPSAIQSPWTRRFNPSSTAIASGWMMIRGNKRNRSVDTGFVLSDHADWNGLNETIRETGAEKVLVTHGYRESMVRWLREKGYCSESLETEFMHNELDIS